MSSIPEEQRSEVIKELDLDKDDLPMERVLGLHWCTEKDKCTFRLSIKEHPHTRRGMLSVVSSIYALGVSFPIYSACKTGAPRDVQVQCWLG